MQFFNLIKGHWQSLTRTGFQRLAEHIQWDFKWKDFYPELTRQLNHSSLLHSLENRSQAFYSTTWTNFFFFLLALNPNTDKKIKNILISLEARHPLKSSIPKLRIFLNYSLYLMLQSLETSFPGNFPKGSSPNFVARVVENLMISGEREAIFPLDSPNIISEIWKQSLKH